MSISDLNRLRETVQSAPEAHADLVREMAAAPDAAGISQVLHSHGYTVSTDELESLSAANGELSDHQLEGIAGGRRGPETLSNRIIAGIFTFGITEIVRATS